MLTRLIRMPFERKILTLCVSYRTMMVPLGGSDFYGVQHLACEVVHVMVAEVNGEPLDYRIRGHYVACEFFLWEAHSNEIAVRTIQKHLQGAE